MISEEEYNEIIYLFASIRKAVLTRDMGCELEQRLSQLLSGEVSIDVVDGEATVSFPENEKTAGFLELYRIDRLL